MKLELALQPANDEDQHLSLFRLVVRLMIQAVPKFQSAITCNEAGKLLATRSKGYFILRTVNKQQRKLEFSGVLEKQPMPAVAFAGI